MTGNSKTSAFISYSWDSIPHMKKVSNLVNRLRSDGIIVEFDADCLELGDRLTHFMERSVSENDYVLYICTPKYKEKADARKAGVGYENSIITAELFETQNERKFIPILFEGSWSDSSPIWGRGKLGVDLRGSSTYNEQYERLITTLNKGYERKPPNADLFNILRIVFSSFAHELSSYFTACLRTNLQFEFLDIGVRKYEELQNSLPQTAKPFRLDINSFPAIIVLSSKTAHFIIDRILGGSKDDFDLKCDLSEIEKILLNRLLGQSLGHFPNVDSSVLDIRLKYIGIESNPFSTLLKLFNETIIDITLNVQAPYLDETMHICISSKAFSNS